MTRLLARLRALGGTTPGRYRLWSAAVALGLVAVAVVGTVAATALQSATNDIRNNSGPVLVATQALVASLAEADAAASAAFLSGRQEDPEQRRLYEEALARASAQVEDVSSLIGDDEEAHRSLKNVAAQITRYAGLAEAALVTNREGVTASERFLVQASDLLGSVVDNEVGTLTVATEDRFERDEERRGFWVYIAASVAVLALGALVLAQRTVTRLSRRLLNIPMVLATVALLVATVWLLAAAFTSTNDLDDARRFGFESISITSRIQSAGFRAKAAETVAVIANDTAGRSRADEAAGDLLSGPVSQPEIDAVRRGAALGQSGLLAEAAARADSARERAAAAEMLVRWQRYTSTVGQLRAAPAGDARRTIAVGPASSTFNGFNFSVESVLSDNRDQFLRGLQDASDRVRWLPAITALVPLVALVAALFGFQLRINEYR